MNNAARAVSLLKDLAGALAVLDFKVDRIDVDMDAPLPTPEIEEAVAQLAEAIELMTAPDAQLYLPYPSIADRLPQLANLDGNPNWERELEKYAQRLRSKLSAYVLGFAELVEKHSAEVDADPDFADNLVGGIEDINSIGSQYEALDMEKVEIKSTGLSATLKHKDESTNMSTANRLRIKSISASLARIEASLGAGKSKISANDATQQLDSVLVKVCSDAKMKSALKASSGDTEELAKRAHRMLKNSTELAAAAANLGLKLSFNRISDEDDGEEMHVVVIKADDAQSKTVAEYSLSSIDWSGQGQELEVLLSRTSPDTEELLGEDAGVRVSGSAVSAAAKPGHTIAEDSLASQLNKLLKTAFPAGTALVDGMVVSNARYKSDEHAGRGGDLIVTFNITLKSGSPEPGEEYYESTPLFKKIKSLLSAAGFKYAEPLGVYASDDGKKLDVALSPRVAHTF